MAKPPSLQMVASSNPAAWPIGSKLPQNGSAPAVVPRRPRRVLTGYALVFCRCFGEDTCISIPDMDAVVMVLQPSEPRITISGADRLLRPESDFAAPDGMALFQDLHIVSTVTRADTAAAADSASASGAAHTRPPEILGLLASFV